MLTADIARNIANILLVLYQLPVFVTSEAIVKDLQRDVTYQGITSNSVEHFLNIKFGEDTSGELRFAPPQRFTPPRGSLVNATVPGAACPQIQDAVPPAFSEVERISEDCLNLRLSRPTGTGKSDKLPVVVFTHGGGIVKGSAYDTHFDPTRLLQQAVSNAQPVIYVAIQHRLSIFGFARLDTLEEEQSLNIGLRDQRAAFEWVKDNVAAFGGDPDRVTAYGHSAGGTFLSLQHFAYGGERGLPFDQGWSMSGPPGTSLNMASNATVSHTLAVARRLGCEDLESHKKVLSCLRKAPMEKLLAVATEHAISNHPPLGLFTFLPSIDGDFLPERPSILLRQGRFVKGVPTVLGWTQDDGAMNAGPAPLVNTQSDMEAPIRKYASELTSSQMSELVSWYPTSDFQADVRSYEARKGPEDPPVSANYFALSRLLRDLLFTCPSLEFSYQMIKQSRSDKTHKSRFNNVRLYDFNHTAFGPLWSAVGMPWIGVSHGSDIMYLFNGLFPEGNLSRSDLGLAQRFSSSLIAFAHDADPNAVSSRGPRTDTWPTAYHSPDTNTEDSMPSEFNIFIVGGHQGSTPARVKESTHTKLTQANQKARIEDTQPIAGFGSALAFGKIQEVILNALNFGQMESSSPALAQTKLQDEKLVQRCAFISSLSETLGI